MKITEKILILFSTVNNQVLDQLIIKTLIELLNSANKKV